MIFSSRTTDSGPHRRVIHAAEDCSGARSPALGGGLQGPLSRRTTLRCRPPRPTGAGIRVRSARELVSRASAAAEFSIARLPRAAVSPGQKTVSRHFPPLGLSPKCPISPCSTCSKVLTRLSERRDTYTQAVGFPILLQLAAHRVGLGVGSGRGTRVVVDRFRGVTVFGAPQLVETGIAGDVEDPGGELGAGLVARRRAVAADEDLLRELLARSRRLVMRKAVAKSGRL